MPPCEGQKSEQTHDFRLPRPRVFLVQGFKKTAYPIEVVSLKMKITPDVFEAYRCSSSALRVSQVTLWVRS
jgi:hypothetical protein